MTAAVLGGGPVLVYVAHPVGAVDRAGIEANLAALGSWLRFLVDLPDATSRRIAWCAPWAAYAHAMPDVQPYRARAMRDGTAALNRCDGLAAFGRMTPGVVAEIDVAGGLGLPTANLIACGPLPPVTSITDWWLQRSAVQITSQLAELVRAIDRRRGTAERSP